MSWSNGLLQIFILRCLGASELSSRELDEPLGTLERVALHGHLLACGSCRRFRGQRRLIQAAIRLREVLPPGARPDNDVLSAEARHRIAHAIRQATQDEADGGR